MPSGFMFTRVQPCFGQASYRGGMHCYCGQPATLRIPSIPEQVCRVHAIEFWTGLLAFTNQRAGGGPEGALATDLLPTGVPAASLLSAA